MFGSLFFPLLLVCASSALDINLPSGYAPRKANCPSTPLVRPANGLSSEEAAYRTNREVNTQADLKAWLQKTNAAFNTSNLPTVGLTTSGGGYRSLLIGAGVIQGLDARDSNVSTSGLF
jgi:lysophospholipase